MQAESGGNSRLIYKEQWGENSVGLYQLSASDSFRYKDCPKTEAELMNPEINTRCKDSIFKTLRAAHPNENVWQVGGRYWATLRRPKEWPDARRKPFEDFKGYAAQRGCSI